MAPINVVHLMAGVMPFYDSVHPTIFEEISASEIFQLYKRQRT
jgi:hypothetical protein